MIKIQKIYILSVSILFMEIKGGLKLIVLKILNEKHFTGYGLIKEIEEKTGFWKPSPGSIYPLMNELLEKGLVTCEKSKNQKIYSITSEGRKVYRQIKEKKEKIVKETLESFKFLEVLGENPEEIEPFIYLLKEFEKGDFPIKENFESIILFRANLMSALEKRKDLEKINKILNESSKKLNEL